MSQWVVVCFIQNGFQYTEIETNLALLARAPAAAILAQLGKAPAHPPTSPPPAPQEGNDVYGEYTPLSARDILTKDLEELRLTVREMKERGGAGAGEEEGPEEEQEEEEDFLAGGEWHGVGDIGVGGTCGCVGGCLVVVVVCGRLGPASNVRPRGPAGRGALPAGGQKGGQETQGVMALVLAGNRTVGSRAGGGSVAVWSPQRACQLLAAHNGLPCSRTHSARVHQRKPLAPDPARAPLPRAPAHKPAAALPRPARSIGPVELPASSLRQLEGHTDEVYSVAWCPTANLLASRCD